MPVWHHKFGDMVTQAEPGGELGNVRLRCYLPKALLAATL